MTLPTHVKALLPSLELDGNGYVTLKAAELENLLDELLAFIEVDETWYLSHYPDVRQAFEDGSLGMTPAEHYRRHGYLEGRLPFVPQVDEVAYRAKYPDVEQGIQQGAVTSAVQHFIKHGYRELRDPQPKAQATPSLVQEPARAAQRGGPVFRRAALG